jgi:hypothetical protein
LPLRRACCCIHSCSQGSPVSLCTADAVTDITHLLLLTANRKMRSRWSPEKGGLVTRTSYSGHCPAALTS